MHTIKWLGKCIYWGISFGNEMCKWKCSLVRTGTYSALRIKPCLRLNICNCCICITFFLQNIFPIGIISDYHRLPVYVVGVIVQTCQRTERLYLISLGSNYIPVCCLIACHCEVLWQRLDGKVLLCIYLHTYPQGLMNTIQ